MKLTLRPLWLPILMVGAALLLCLATAAQAQLTSSAPPAPQNVTGHTLMTTDGYAVLLVWDDPDDDTITGYEWRRVGSVSTTEWTTIAGNVSDAALPGLRMGVRYHFELRSVHDDGTRSGTAAIRYEMSEDEIVYQVPAVVVGEDLAAPPADEPPTLVTIGPSTRSTPSTADQTGGRYNYYTYYCTGSSNDPDVCKNTRGASTLPRHKNVDGEEGCTTAHNPMCHTSYPRPGPSGGEIPQATKWLHCGNAAGAESKIRITTGNEQCPTGQVTTGTSCSDDVNFNAACTVKTTTGSANDPARFETEFCWDDTTTLTQWWGSLNPGAGKTRVGSDYQTKQQTVNGVTTTRYLYTAEVTSRVCNVRAS